MEDKKMNQLQDEELNQVSGGAIRIIHGITDEEDPNSGAKTSSIADRIMELNGTTKAGR